MKQRTHKNSEPSTSPTKNGHILRSRSSQKNSTTKSFARKAYQYSRREILHTKASTLQFYNGTQIYRGQLCAIADSNFCLRRNTVYQIIICINYKQFFMGRTIRFTHANSSVKKHILVCQKTINNRSIEVKALI